MRERAVTGKVATIGVDVGGTSISGGLVRDGGEVLATGTEIGGAFVAGDVVVRGAHGFGGELGHVPVNVDGPRCGCGGRGCLGAYLGGRQLAAEARRRVMDGASSTLVERAAGDVDAITSSMVFAAAAAGDRLAEMLVDE